MLSISHLIVLFVVVLVIFGPQKLPELARGLGKLTAELRKASSEFRFAFEEEMRDIERHARNAALNASASPSLPSPSPEERTAAAEPPGGITPVAISEPVATTGEDSSAAQVRATDSASEPPSVQPSTERAPDGN